MLTSTQITEGSVTSADEPTPIRRSLTEHLGGTAPKPGLGLEVAHGLGLEPGRVVALHGPPGSGLTRVGLGLLVEISRQAPVVAVDIRGWLNPAAAWEVGIDPDRFVVVGADARSWARVVGALLDGVPGIYAELPSGVPDAVVRRVAATARTRRVGLVLRPLRGALPTGTAHLTVRAEDVQWTGVGAGVGHLGARGLALWASGKGVSGLERRLEVDDDGTHPLHLVAGLAPAAPRRTAG
jgi:hypothetical protein